MENLAIIPARGGSKGIPRKNLAPLCGKPLVAWTIEAALAAKRVSRVAVSTDDFEIAAAAKRYGAEVVWRSPEASGDVSPSEQALIECLDYLADAERYEPDVVTMLQCTSPLTAGEDIDGVLATLESEQADSALAVTDFHYYLWRQTTGGAEGVNHDASHRLMRQQQEPQMLECGSVYAMRTAGLRDAGHRFFGKVVLHPTPAERCWEIDDPVDLDVAEVLLRKRLTREAGNRLPEVIDALVFDFDGVMTDNRVTVTQSGQESVSCSRGDGMGVALLRDRGVPTLVLSSETNPVVAARCAKLKLPVIDSTGDKWPVLSDWLARRGLRPENTVYVGNDVNDLECLERVGCGVAVADAVSAAKRSADIVLATAGGAGAVRELCDLLLQHTGEARFVQAA